MRTPPADLDPDALTATLRAGWAIDATAIEHQPVGFGSYHWIVEVGTDRWWVTVSPAPGNLIDADGQWLLVDWDTIGVAPPERDLWMFVGGGAHPDLGDAGRAVIDRYEAATGVELDPDLLEAYRLRWDIADAAEYVRHLRAPHVGSADDDQAWANLQAIVERLAIAAR